MKGCQYRISGQEGQVTAAVAVATAGGGGMSGTMGNIFADWKGSVGGERVKLEQQKFTQTGVPDAEKKRMLGSFGKVCAARGQLKYYSVAFGYCKGLSVFIVIDIYGYNL